MVVRFRGLQDTCTPVDLLLALHASAWLNDDGMPSFSPEQRRAQEQLANEIGMMDSRDARQRQWIPPLLMAYLEQTLKAKQFPFGDSLDESIAGDTVARIASFLFDESPAEYVPNVKVAASRVSIHRKQHTLYTLVASPLLP